jgi:hypothetical protein
MQGQSLIKKKSNPVKKSLLKKVGGQGIKNLDENDNKFLSLEYNGKPLWTAQEKRIMRRYAKKNKVSPMEAGHKLGYWE